MPTVDISPGFPIYYETSGSGLPLVFIHPPHMGQDVFKYQHKLSKHFRVITYDIRGHGRSGSNAEKVTIPRLAEDLRTFLDALDIEQAVIVGYSAGGSIAQHFALTYPERVKALVLSGGFPEVSTFILKRQYRIGLAFIRNNRDRLLSKLLAKTHKVTKEDEREVYVNSLKAEPHIAYDYYNESLHYTCANRLHELRMPFLLLNGQYSFHMHPYIKYYMREVPQTKHVFISNGLHQIPIQNYHPFNHALGKFVKGL
jgi:pimeloyl-ACP methyl ester carboxylesterase